MAKTRGERERASPTIFQFFEISKLLIALLQILAVRNLMQVKEAHLSCFQSFVVETSK